MKIDVTPRAIEELKKLLEKKNANDKCVRVYVAGFG